MQCWGVIWVLALLMVSRRNPVSFPLQLSSFCNQLGSLFVFSTLQMTEECLRRGDVGSVGPVGFICFILKACGNSAFFCFFKQPHLNYYQAVTQRQNKLHYVQ